LFDMQIMITSLISSSSSYYGVAYMKDRLTTIF
jgi:hypothetical protein